MRRGAPPPHQESGAVQGWHLVIKNRGIPAMGRAVGSHHGLTDDMVDTERLTVELIAGLELAVHLVGEVVKSTMNIIIIADYENVISNGFSGMSHKAVTRM